MSPFKALGLKKNATAIEIKRAYAIRLKQTRPDDDPKGFQRLNEAFHAALESAKQRDIQHASKDEHQELAASIEVIQNNEAIKSIAPFMSVAEIGQEADLAEDIQEPEKTSIGHRLLDADPTHDALTRDTENQLFSFDAFIDEMQLAGDKELEQFQYWLNTHPALYSLSLKSEITWPLLEYLANAERPLLPRFLAALLAFFQLDTVTPRHFGLNHLIELAKEHAELFWRPELVALQLEGDHHSWIDRKLFRELKVQSTSRRRFLISLFPGFKSRLRNLANLFAEIPPEYQRRVVDPAEVDFWLSASDPSRFDNRDALVVASCILGLVLAGGFMFPDIWQLELAIGGIVYAAWLLITWNRIRAYKKARTIQITHSTDFNWSWIWILIVLANVFRHLLD